MRKGQASEQDPRRRLNSLIGQARLALWWEEAWPRLWGPLTVLTGFATVSWLGLWLDAPPRARIAGLALFALAALISLWPLLRLRLPRRSDALDRLDRDAPLPHGPARTLDDNLALGSTDAGSRALWDLHRRRAETEIATLRVSPPRPDMPRRDRYALRVAAILALAASAFVAGPETGARLEAAFDWSKPRVGGPAFRIDGWIDPPLHTHMPPVMIDLTAGEQHLRVPAQSTLVIRVAGKGDATILPGHGLTPLPDNQGQPGLQERKFTLQGDAELSVRTGLGRNARLTIESVPDQPPTIAFTAPPETDDKGTLTLTYKGHDDYGIASVEGEIGKADASHGTRSLVPPPSLALVAPSQNDTETKAPAALTDNPWAGARVKLRLIAKDAIGQQGMSEPIELTLPQRPFTNPLAKALVEQRRNLILDPEDRKRVQTALDALLIAPDSYLPEWGVFLGLKIGADRLRQAATDQDLIDVADWLWTIALQLEDGHLSEAERELRAAQDRLKAAMERGAPADEISRLMQEMRQAMNRYLSELAQRGEANPQARHPSRADRVISQDELNRMLQQMEDALRRGDMAQADRLRQQLENILQNLRTGQPDSRMSDPLSREMNQAMQDLENLTREQQALRDQTFQQGQDRRMHQGEHNRPGQNQQNAQDPSLGARQQALRQRLKELQDKMRGMGMQGEQGLGDADQAMGEAEDALGQGQDGPAVEAQGKALENLRKGMQGMAQQMQEMQQGEDGQDQQAGGQPGGQGPLEQQTRQPGSDETDPLGRSKSAPDGRLNTGASPAERAKQILDELRNKLGDPSRQQEELDYFERLLRRN